MLFSSIPFLFYFLPPVLLLYFLTPDRWKNLTLLLSSLVFYGWGEPRFLLFMLASIAQGYAFGRLMERYPRRKRLFLTLSAVLSLGLLGYCKYAGFFLRTLGALTGLSLPALQIALPIGISFYTFQVLSYVIDVYRGTVPPQRNLLQLATYVAMFPQLIAGPIVRYADIAPELTRRRHTLKGLYHNDTEDGLKIYFCGNTISPTYLNDIIKVTKGKRFSINVISKSGTTTETALAFRVLRKLLEDSVGPEEANKRIYATTDRAKGTLKQLADAQGWPTFVVPDDVGGRYSVLTAVGLLPIACAGIDIGRRS